MTPELQANWDGVWGLFLKLQKKGRLSAFDTEMLAYHLNECEQGQKDTTIEAYIVMCLAARRRRLAKARGIALTGGE